MISLDIPGVLPSLNVQMRMHWATYKRTRTVWCGKVWHALQGRKPAHPMPFARITFTRHSARFLDADNLAGAHKPLLDVLRPVSKSNPNGLGVIEDDSASHVAVTYAQAKCPAKDAHTTIVIERGAA